MVDHEYFLTLVMIILFIPKVVDEKLHKFFFSLIDQEKSFFPPWSEFILKAFITRKKSSWFFKPGSYFPRETQTETHMQTDTKTKLFELLNCQTRDYKELRRLKL